MNATTDVASQIHYDGCPSCTPRRRLSRRGFLTGLATLAATCVAGVRATFASDARGAGTLAPPALPGRATAFTRTTVEALERPYVARWATYEYSADGKCRMVEESEKVFLVCRTTTTFDRDGRAISATQWYDYA